MLATLRALGLAAAVVLAAPATGVAQSSTFMKVPQEVWTNINRFVFLVALDVNAAPGHPEYARRQAAVPSWPDIYAEAKQWPTLTLPYLQMLAGYVVEDEKLVDQRLADMVKAADALAPGQVEKLSQYDQTHARDRFDQMATFLEGRMDVYLGTALAIQVKLQDLVRVSGAILRAQTQDLALLDIEVKAGQAKSALDASMAAWSGLKSDITELRRVVTAAKKADPDLYTRVAQIRWADVARDARGLLTDLKAQQRYLQGEDYYDNCGLKDGQSYRLKTNAEWGYLGATPSLQAAACGLGGCQFQDNNSYRGIYALNVTLPWTVPLIVQWRFRKLHHGWWQMYNAGWGERHVLDGVRGHAFAAPTDVTKGGQAWRALPAPGNRCYLVNSFEGAGYALEPAATDVDAGDGYRSKPVVLMPRSDASPRQQWSFEPN